MEDTTTTDPHTAAAIREFAARVDARAGSLIQAGRARNAHYFALREELALLPQDAPVLEAEAAKL